MLKITLSFYLLMSGASLVMAADNSIQDKLTEAANGQHRSAKNIARNDYRHPEETLQFFGIKSDMTVIEITPGGLWYSEILAPALMNSGQYVAAGYDTSIDGTPTYRTKQQEAMETRFKGDPAVYGNVKIAKFSPPESIDLGEASSADMVVTFRNSHGWIRDGVDTLAYQAFYDVLIPGGILGVVQHRGPASAAGFTGYVTEAQIISVAEKAGFVLEAKSEINANAKDTKDYPKGVWTLPPSLRLGDVEREKYIAIGESDRMTLRFRKPLKN